MKPQNSIDFLDLCKDVFVGELLTHKGGSLLSKESKANFKVTRWIQGGHYGKVGRYKERKIFVPTGAILKKGSSYLVAVNKTNDYAEALILAPSSDPIVELVAARIKTTTEADFKHGEAIPEIFMEMIMKLPIAKSHVYTYRYDRQTTIEVSNIELKFGNQTVQLIDGSSFGEMTSPYIAVTSSKLEGENMIYQGRTSEGGDFHAVGKLIHGVWHITDIIFANQKTLKGKFQ